MKSRKWENGCNCVHDMDVLLGEEYPGQDTVVQWVRNKEMGTFPRMFYTYRKIKADGLATKRIYEEVVLPTFCPFCGKRYVRKQRVPKRRVWKFLKRYSKCLWKRIKSCRVRVYLHWYDIWVGVYWETSLYVQVIPCVGIELWRKHDVGKYPVPVMCDEEEE